MQKIYNHCLRQTFECSVATFVVILTSRKQMWMTKLLAKFVIENRDWFLPFTWCNNYTAPNTTWPLYSSLSFNFTIMTPLLSADLGNMLQLISTSETIILQILPFIFNDLSFGITVTFLNKILLDTSNLSSLRMSWNNSGNI